MRQGILLTVDYHDQNCVIRRFDRDRGVEDLLTVPTTAGDLRDVLAEARRRAGPRAPLVWLQESTTGWARVQALVGSQAEFVLANVLQMPLPPKGVCGGGIVQRGAGIRRRGNSAAHNCELR